jgi:hypothetical protein
MVILFLLSAIIIAIGKAIADITSDETNWSKSIFSKYKINSFFGCKDNTWERKYYFKNKTLKYLFSTIFVFTTDIWHLGNFISKVGTYTSTVFYISRFFQKPELSTSVPPKTTYLSELDAENEENEYLDFNYTKNFKNKRTVIAGSVKIINGLKLKI